MNKIPILNNDDWDETMLSKRCELYSMYSSLTSSSLKGLMMASIFFIIQPFSSLTQ